MGDEDENTITEGTTKSNVKSYEGHNPRPIMPPTRGKVPTNPCPPPMPPTAKTFYTPRPTLSVGEYWYVKRKRLSTLSEFKITDVTEHTVLLNECGRSSGSHRYKIDDVEFVERIDR